MERYGRTMELLHTLQVNMSRKMITARKEALLLCLGREVNADDLDSYNLGLVRLGESLVAASCITTVAEQKKILQAETKALIRRSKQGSCRS